jgi:hypothetical protein
MMVACYKGHTDIVKMLLESERVDYDHINGTSLVRFEFCGSW